MNEISNPAEGLTVYCTNCDPKGLYIFNGTEFSPIVSGVDENGVFVACEASGFNGVIAANYPVNGTYDVSITNNTFSSSTISLTTNDLVLSGVTGVSVTGIRVNGASSSSVSLNSGETKVVSYVLSGSPNSTGELVGKWTKLGLKCTKTKNIGNGDATFALKDNYTVSLNDGTPPVSIQGVVDNADNQIVINVPYTNGVGSYDAYTSNFVTGATGEAGDTNGFSISYPAGNFDASGTGTIPVTITVDGDATYNVKRQLFGEQQTIVTIPFIANGEPNGNIVLKAIGGILDREYNNANDTHKFIYVPVVTYKNRKNVVKQ